MCMVIVLFSDDCWMVFLEVVFLEVISKIESNQMLCWFKSHTLIHNILLSSYEILKNYSDYSAGPLFFSICTHLN